MYFLAPPAEKQRSFSNADLCVVRLSVRPSRLRAGFPQGLENREKNNGQGKVREFYFGPKVREKSGNFVLNCRLP